MRFLVYGEDTYRSRKKLAAIRERFSATRDVSGLNVAIFSAGQATAEQASEAICASPFLAEKKMVILEGFLRSGSAEQAKIEQVLAKKPDSTVIVFFESSSAETLAKSPLFPNLKAEKFSEEFPALSPASAERFAAEEASAAGMKLDPKAARTLVALIGTDSRQLHEEVAKLSAFALGSKSQSINEDIVLFLVADGREAEIFAFLDACTEGRSRESSKLLEKLLATGTAELQVIAMLLKHYRAALAAHDLIARGRADAQMLAKSLGMHPFPAGKAIVFAKRHSREALGMAYERLVAMERDAKSGGPKPKVSLALFAAAASK